MSKHERNKSGGFLDTLFTRSAKRGHRNTYSANGTRPLSANEADNNDMQDIENLILKLTFEEVNQRFNEILEDMNIPKDKRDPLMKKNLDEKRDMLRMHLKGKQPAWPPDSLRQRRKVSRSPFPPPALTQFHAQLRVPIKISKKCRRIAFHSFTSAPDDRIFVRPI